MHPPEPTDRPLATAPSPAPASSANSIPQKKRHTLLWLLLGGVGVIFALRFYTARTFPSDKTPIGAYLRVVRAVNQTKPAEFFAYTEEEAQHACYSIRDYRKKSLELVREHFPEDKREEFEEKFGRIAQAPDGVDVFAILAIEYGWLDQLRLDMSGVLRVEESGARATIETVRGTRYAFRRRPGGIWGLTAFTPTLVEEAEKAARDHKLVEKSAADYQRVINRKP